MNIIIMTIHHSVHVYIAPRVMDFSMLVPSLKLTLFGKG